MKYRAGIAKLAIGAGLLAVALAGCGGSGGKSSASGSTTSVAPTTSTTAAPPTQAVVSATGVRVIPGSATGKSPCEKAAPTPASPGEVGAGAGGSQAITTKAGVQASEHGVRGAVEPVALTAAEKSALAQQMTAAAQVAQTYPTVKDALAAGYMMSTVYVPCIGAHYTNIKLAAQFDPAHPSELLYDGTSPDSKIVGLSYLVWHHNGPPPGFAGPNDRWHQHNANGGLCIRGRRRDRGRGVDAAGVCAGGRTQDAAHRHLDGARLDRARHRVRLGRLQRRMPGARWPPRRHCVRRSLPEQDLLAEAATTPRCGAGGSPSRRAPRARRASTCPGPSRGAGSSRVNRPGSRSGKSTRCHRITSRRRGAPSAAWNTASNVSSERSERCSRLGA